MSGSAGEVDLSPYRPRLVDQAVAGSWCPECGASAAPSLPRCPTCSSTMEPTRFGATGTVWSSSRVELSVGGLEPPFVLAYVDLDVVVQAPRQAAPPELGAEPVPCRSPRILALVAGDRSLAGGTRVALSSEHGELVARTETP